VVRFLVRVQPERMEEVKASLPPAVRVVSQAYDYISLDMPEELVPTVRAIPGVIEVRRERVVGIMQYMPIPVERKLTEFMRLVSNPLTLPQAFSYSLRMAAGKTRWSTMGSRKLLGADYAEEIGITGKGVKVAVLDTGWDPTNPQYMVRHFRSSVEGQPAPIDENGHSTHCYTTIAGRAFPTPWGWVKGVAPDVELGVFKVLGYGMGAGTESSVLRGMIDAFEWGADIISMSLGSSVPPDETVDIAADPECRVVKMLAEEGIIFCIAAGNDGEGYASVPGLTPEAVTVAAIDRNGIVANFSSRGHAQYMELNKPDCAAPGVDVLSTTCGLIDTMEFMDGPKLGAISGTSMATPHVSGWVALVKQLFRENGVELTAKMVKDIFKASGRDWNPSIGYGIPSFQIAEQYLRTLGG